MKFPSHLFVTFFLIFTCSFTAFAQKVTYKNEQVLADGQPYALLKKGGNPIVKDFSLRNLQGQELAVVKPTIIDLPNGENYIFYTITFFPEGQQAELENTMNVGKKLAEATVQYELVKNNMLNPEGVKKFLQVNNQKFSERINNVSAAAITTPAGAGLQYQTVTRNRQADVSVMGKTIMQDFKTIGSFTQTDQATRGIIVRTLRFFLPDGTQVAEATFEGLNADNCRLVTLKDNKMHHVPAGANDLETPEQIARFLSGRFYL